MDSKRNYARAFSPGRWDGTVGRPPILSGDRAGAQTATVGLSAGRAARAGDAPASRQTPRRQGPQR